MNNVITTFHGAVYGKKVTRKESDLPADLTNASAATRRVYEPTVSAAKQTTEHKRQVKTSLQFEVGVFYDIHCVNMMWVFEQQAT